MSDVEIEDLGGLTSPENAPDLTDADVARSVPLVCMALALDTQTEFSREFFLNPANVDFSMVLDNFRKWCHENKKEGTDEGWMGYLADSRASLLDGVWSTYDPANQIEDEDVKDLIGDELLGASLFFQFLESAGAVSERDGERFVALWSWLIVADLLTEDDEDTPEESDATEKESDVW